MTEMRKPAVGGGGQGRSAVSNSQLRAYYNTICRKYENDDVALAVRKRSRLCVVAKLTHFSNEREKILAVAWRGQKGTEKAISMPVAVLEYARQRNVRRFYLRNDRTHTMLTCDISLFDKGSLRNDGERYIPLSWLEPTAWRNWAYSDKVVEIEQPQQTVAVQQLSLWGAAA